MLVGMESIKEYTQTIKVSKKDFDAINHYLTVQPRTEDGLRDLKKAEWYLSREIERMKRE